MIIIILLIVIKLQIIRIKLFCEEYNKSKKIIVINKK